MESVLHRAETEFQIRFYFFLTKRIVESVSCLCFSCWNGICIPFGVFIGLYFVLKRILYSISEKNLQFFLWNGIQNPFHTVRNGFCIPFHKKIYKFFYETEYRIRFKTVWNGFCIPFRINYDFRIIAYVSQLNNLFGWNFRSLFVWMFCPTHKHLKSKHLNMK